MDVLLALVVLWTFPLCIEQTSTQPVLDEYCEWDTYNPMCGPDEVVLIQKAVYGRMRTGSCIKDNRDIGCHRDVTNMAHRKCSGRRNCQITIPDRDFDRTQPCGEMKNYLQIRNTCVKVEEGTGSSTCRSCEYIKVTGPSGYISSAITQENNCGGADCPWLIEAGAGQKILVTIYDFNTTTTQSSSMSPTCIVYAVLKEVRSRTSTTVCGGKEYRQELEVTENQSLEVRIIGPAARSDTAQFLLHYQVIGCADMPPVDGTLSSRNRDVTTVVCHNDRSVRWILECNATTGEWQGEARECDNGETGDENTDDTRDRNKSKFPYGVSLVLILSIAVVVGICILMIGVCYFKKSNHVQKDRLRAQVPASMAPEAVYAEYGHNMNLRDPRQESPSGDCVMDPTNRKFYQTYGPAQAQGMRNEYTHIWDRPLPQPSNSLNKYPQAI